MADEQPPPTYELALKMITKETTIGNLPNATNCWMDTEPGNDQVVSGYGLPLSCKTTEGFKSATNSKQQINYYHLTVEVILLCYIDCRRHKMYK